MSSVAGLLVPNNFVLAGSTGSDVAEALYSNNNTNVIDVTSAANPISGQALVAISANAADWQDVVLPAGNQIITDKDLLSNTNQITARNLFSGGATNTISIGGAPNPTAGQVLTATSPTAATWQTPQPPVLAHGAEGTFGSVFGGAGPQPIITIDFGTLRGGFLVEMTVVAIDSGGVSMTSWNLVAAFLRNISTGVTTQVGTTTVTKLKDSAPMSGEPNPTLTVVPGMNQAVLTKIGAVLNNTYWGGSWKYSISGEP